MKATTGQILGKAHKLCEWIRKEGSGSRLGDGAVSVAWAIDGSQKWHIGDPNELADADREILDSLPLRLPVKHMLIEAEIGVLMADDRVEPGNWFDLCMDNEDGSIDVLSFQSVGGRFQFLGVGQIRGVAGKREVTALRDTNRPPSTAENAALRTGVRILERTLLALACTNVRSVDNAPPAALNKKRQKAGKPPLFTYKTLRVDRRAKRDTQPTRRRRRSAEKPSPSLPSRPCSPDR